MDIIYELEIYKSKLDNIANGLYERTTPPDYRLMSAAANLGQKVNDLMEAAINFEGTYFKEKSL